MAATDPKLMANRIAQARLQKAIALTDQFEHYGYSVSLVEAMSQHHWHIAAAAAHVNPPSEETKDLVLRMLQAREELKQKNPHQRVVTKPN